MLTIVITIIIALIMIWILAAAKLRTHDITFIILVIVIAGILIAREPIHGYEEPVLEEYSLAAFEEEETYVKKYLNDVYLYRAEKPNEQGKTTYVENILRENVKENEDTNCVKPVLRRYTYKPKKGLFTICDEAKMTYEFYVPTNTISHVNDSIT